MIIALYVLAAIPALILVARLLPLWDALADRATTPRRRHESAVRSCDRSPPTPRPGPTDRVYCGRSTPSAVTGSA
jgi:hypothetical protein